MSSETKAVFLRDLIEVNPKVKMQKGQSYPFVDMAAVKEWQRDVSMADIKPREFKGSGSKFESGDILLARITPCFENGKTAIAPSIHGPGHGSTEFIVIRPKDPRDHAFVYGLLRSPEFRSYAIGQMVGTSGRQRIPNEAVLNFSVELPEECYRHKVAHLLGNVEDVCSNLHHQNSTLEAIAQRLFRSWFVNFDPVHAKAADKEPEAMSAEVAALFPREFENSELGPIPKGWLVSPYADTVEILSGGTPKTSVGEYWNGEIPWFSVTDAPVAGQVFVLRTEKHITKAGLENSPAKLLPSRSTIISARGTVGKIGMVSGQITINQSCYALSPKNDQGVYWVYFQTRNLVSVLKQMAHGGVFDTITRDTFKGVKVVIPHKAIFDAFSSVSKPLFDAIECNGRLVLCLNELRDHLLPRLISGELSLEEAEKAVEDATAA